MKKIATAVIGMLIIGIYAIGITIENYKIRKDIEVLYERDSKRQDRIIELRYESKVYREFLQEINNITKDCYKCKQKVLNELSQDFETFEVLTK